MLWSALRTLVRRSILHDDTENVWTNVMLADFAAAALDAFCAHTAPMKSATYTGANDNYQFTLPTDVYLSPAEFGLVYLIDPNTTGAEPCNLVPSFSSYDISPNDARAYTVWPETVLETGIPVSDGMSLVVRYYGYYTHPVADTDVLAIPSWAAMPLAYDIGTHALTWRTLQESDVGSDRQKPDNGQPEQNAYRSTQSWWIKLYEREMARQPRQTRIRPVQK